jgi:pimeloyl-ACP methyl ester carboxylesterase
MFLDGGPSFGAINTFAVDFYFGGASYTQDRDVVLVDTRGTGLSQPRPECPEFDQADKTSFFAKPYVYPRDVVVESFSRATLACRDRLRGDGIDLASYNTAESAADLDALRRALGYRTWNVIGLSADGGLALTYMRLFPDGVRSTIIDSGQSTQWLGTLDYGRGVSLELERIFTGCSANTACNASYPNVRRLFYALVQQLQAHPVYIPISQFPGGPVTFKVDGVTLFQDTVGQIFPGNAFAPDAIKPLLATLWRETHGQLTQVYEEGNSGGAPPTFDFFRTAAFAKTMSYTCHDQISFITQADLRQAAEDVPALAPQYLDPAFALSNGDPASPAGCRLWDVGRADAIQHKPVSSPIPTLVLAGEYDIGVPDLVVRQIPPTLPNSFFYQLPASPHIQLANFNNDSTCARSIAGQFLNAPQRRPNSDCIAAIPPYDFTP